MHSFRHTGAGLNDNMERPSRERYALPLDRDWGRWAQTVSDYGRLVSGMLRRANAGARTVLNEVVEGGATVARRRCG